MDGFFKRFRLYFVGLLIGGVLSYFFLGDRLANKGWLPGERIKDRLTTTLTKATPEAQEALDARGITLADIRAEVKSGVATMKDPNHRDDSLFYFVQCKVKGKDLHFLSLMNKDFRSDSTAWVWRVE